MEGSYSQASYCARMHAIHARAAAEAALAA